MFTLKFEAPHYSNLKPVEVEYIYDGEHLRNTRGDVIERESIRSHYLVVYLIIQEGVEHIPRRAFDELEQLSRLKWRTQSKLLDLMHLHIAVICTKLLGQKTLNLSETMHFYLVLDLDLSVLEVQTSFHLHADVLGHLHLHIAWG